MVVEERLQIEQRTVAASVGEEHLVVAHQAVEQGVTRAVPGGLGKAIGEGAVLAEGTRFLQHTARAQQRGAVSGV